MYSGISKPLTYITMGLFFGCIQEKMYDYKSFELICMSLDDFYGNTALTPNEMISIEGTNKAKYGTLKKNSFRKDPNLTVLSIRNCLHEIEAGAFNGLDKIKHLIIVENNIPVIKENTFNIRPNHLDLELCNIRNIEPGAFGNISSISIENNHLSAIQKNIFTNLETRALFLKFNKIKYIEKHAFAGMKKLKYLELSYNLLDTYDASDIFGNAVSAKLLRLDHNKIKHIGRTMLTFMSELEIFNISSNGLDFIENHAFEDLHNIEIIDLSNNNLKMVSENIISLKNSIQNLFLHNNDLTYLSLEFMNKLNHSKAVTLANNPWQCSCVVIINNWMKIHEIKDLCENDVHGCLDDDGECYFDMEKSKYWPRNQTGSCFSPHWGSLKQNTGSPYD